MTPSDWMFRDPLHVSENMASTREEGEFSESSSSSGEEESDDEQSSGKPGPSALKFKNDGSFLEMFKKMQDNSQQPKQVAKPESKNNTPQQAKCDDSKVSSSHDDGPVKKTEEEASTTQQKKPGLMSIVSVSFSTV